MTSPSVSIDSAASGHTADQPPVWLRAVLWVGVILTVISFLAVVTTVVLYFVNAPQPTVLFWLGLYGFPLGFILVLLHLLGAAIVRRRR